MFRLSHKSRRSSSFFGYSQMPCHIHPGIKSKVRLLLGGLCITASPTHALPAVLHLPEYLCPPIYHDHAFIHFISCKSKGGMDLSVRTFRLFKSYTCVFTGDYPSHQRSACHPYCPNPRECRQTHSCCCCADKTAHSDRSRSWLSRYCPSRPPPADPQATHN